MKLPVPTVLLAAVLGVCAQPALAEKADRNKPMNVEADALRYDDLKQTSIATGKVVVTKGTILIRGARMDIRQDPEGYHYAVVTPEPGGRAFYRQKREGVDEWIEGEGETIEYDGRADKVKFIGKAEMRRLRGGTLADELNGSLITYDNTTDMFTVDGGQAGKTANNPGGRVRAVLAPRATASAPAVPATPPAQLRATPGLAEDRK